MKKQACPLCFSDASFEFTSNPSGKYFSCLKCTEFFIDASSEKYIEDLPEVTKTECREKLSNLAKMQKKIASSSFANLAMKSEVEMVMVSHKHK